MEVSRAHHRARAHVFEPLREHERVVGGGVRLDRQRPAHEGQGIAGGAVHLRHAAQRVGILHLGAVLVLVRGIDLAAGEERAQVGRHARLPLVPTDPLNGCEERLVRPHQPLDGHRRRDVRDPRAPLRLQQGEHTDRLHRLRAVHQRESFLRLEHHGLKPGARERLPPREPLSPRERFPLADQHQREVCERRQIAARAHGPLLRNDRNDVAMQHLEEQLQGALADARISPGEHVGAQKHERPHLGQRQRRAGARRVREDQVALQLAQIAFGNRHFGQRAESGVDAVGRRVALGDALHQRPGRPHPLPGGGGDLHARTSARRRAHLFQ